MAKRWLDRGWNIWGTHRTRSESLFEIEQAGVKSVHCDLASPESMKTACEELRQLCPEWDVLVLGPGTQAPVGLFEEVHFDEWRESIDVNFTMQLGMVHGLLPTRRTDESGNGPLVLFFAGGATNNAVVRYSGYMVSKIALIKMCELLDAEMPDTRFTIVGPGWVGTKIHDETLHAGKQLAGDNYDKTVQKLADEELTPMDEVLDSCDWVVDSPRNVVSGRNFSTVYDHWGDEELDSQLIENTDMYKLRRAGNDKLVREPRISHPGGS